MSDVVFGPTLNSSTMPGEYFFKVKNKDFVLLNDIKKMISEYLKEKDFDVTIRTGLYE